MMFFKKIMTSMSLMLVTTFLLTACSNKNNSTTEVLDESGDNKTKIALLIQDKSENKTNFDVAESVIASKEYQREKMDNSNVDIKLFKLPKNYSENEKEVSNIFADIEKDKDINVLVASSNEGGLANYVKALKGKRKDILTISANLADNDEELINTFDLNFKNMNVNKAKRVVDFSNSLGAEFFYYFVDESQKNDKKIEETIALMKKTAIENSMPIVEIVVPDNLDKYGKKMFVSNKIDELIIEKGKEINVFAFNQDYDDILLSKVIKNGIYISEFSSPNIDKKMLNYFGIGHLSRNSEDYGWMNTQIINYLGKYGIERHIGSIGALQDPFVLQFAIELGISMNAKEQEVSKAYNSYYLEKVSNTRCNISSGFINKKSGVGNFKYVIPDQISY